MTNTEIIQAIKAEIEGLKSIEYPCDNSQQATGFFNALDRMTDFLDTLESEKPMNPEAAMKELDEKIALVKRKGTWDGVDVDKYMDEVRGREPEKPINQEKEVKPCHRTRNRLAEWSKTPEGRVAYEKVAEEMRKQIVQNDLEEAADEHVNNIAYCGDDIELEKEQSRRDFIAGAKWQKEQDEEEQADLFTIVALDAAQRAKEQMMKDIPKWHKVQRGSCFDKYTNFLLSAREGHFYCYSIEVPRDGYILLVDELERLPKEDEK